MKCSNKMNKLRNQNEDRNFMVTGCQIVMGTPEDEINCENNWIHNWNPTSLLNYQSITNQST